MHYKYAHGHLKAIADVYAIGIEVLQAIKKCLVNQNSKYGIDFEEIDKKKGELLFNFAGIGLYARVIVINGKKDYFGKIAWGRYIIDGEKIIQENPVVENAYQQDDDNEHFFLCEDGEKIFEIGGEPPLYLLQNIWKAIEDLF